MLIAQLLQSARSSRCSDVHITAERNPVFRIDGELRETELQLTREEKNELIWQMLDREQRAIVDAGKDLDFCFALDSGERHRVNIFHQQKQLACAIRVINDHVPTFEQLGLPDVFKQFADEASGLVLVTGPTGSGKSTTLAAMIERINTMRAKHILTIEDPIEYLYKQKRSVIHQREIGVDVDSFAGALRSSLREDPDVILVGEMRDFETISAAITAAETGHLVFSTLHTIGASDTIDRIIDVFPAGNQQQIRTQLSSVLKGVITQQLLPRADGSGRIAAFEIMTGTEAILNLIRENKGHQIDGMIQTGGKSGMITMSGCLANMVKRNLISLECAMEKARKKGELMEAIRA